MTPPHLQPRCVAQSAYARVVRCPVLRLHMVLPGRRRRAQSVACRRCAICLRACYAMLSTDKTYGGRTAYARATRSPVLTWHTGLPGDARRADAFDDHTRHVAVRCPVLTLCVLDAAHGRDGSDTASGGTRPAAHAAEPRGVQLPGSSVFVSPIQVKSAACLRVRYAMPGADMPCRATSPQRSSTHRGLLPAEMGGAGRPSTYARAKRCPVLT
eukprot:66673-Rhodomonas_salina.10